MDMEPQSGQGQSRYCPTPIMAPPASSPVPPMSHPPPSISPAHPPPHHTYSPYPTYPQHSYYQGYPSYQTQAQAPAYQHPQQWGHHHHSYYQPQHQTQSSYQPEYPPPAQSPYPPYHQQQQQQPHHHQTPQAQPQGQQSQTQPHALMNLSRFVSQQSPSPAPRSPTTPVPVPVGSPHYPTAFVQQHQGHHYQQQHQPPPQQQQPYPGQGQGQLQQQYENPPPTTTHHTPHVPHTQAHNLDYGQGQAQGPGMGHNIQSQGENVESPSSKPGQGPVPVGAPEVTTTSGPAGLHSHVHGTSSGGVNSQMPLSQVLAPLTNGSIGGRSESNSPASSIVSSSRMQGSPPTTPTPNSTANGHHMIPVRLQNMQTGARTKASMRKLMQEQQVSSTGGLGSGGEEGSASDGDLEPARKKTPTKGGRGKKKGAVAVTSGDQGQVPVSVGEGKEKEKKKPGRKPKKVKEEVEKEVSADASTPKKARGRKKSETVGPEEEEENPVESSKPAPKTKKRGRVSASITLESDAEVGKEDVPVPVETEETPTETRKGRAVRKPKKRQGTPVSTKTPKKTPTPKKALKRRSKTDEEQEVEEEKVVLEEEIEERDIPATSEPVVETPTRTLRVRVAKDQTKKKQEETSESDRSRHGRAKRASVNYKEMSTSRSKSPKEAAASAAVATTPSPMRSPPSPKKSPRKTSPPKSSPRLKDASPSPVRVRQVKEEASGERQRRESRSASKEMEETVSTTKRASKKLTNEESTIKSPSSKRQSRKPSKDSSTTPARVPSPRLAKDRSTTPASSTPTTTPDVSSVEQPEIEKTPKRRKSQGQGAAAKQSKPRAKKGGVAKEKLPTETEPKPKAQRKRKLSKDTEPKEQTNNESVDVEALPASSATKRVKKVVQCITKSKKVGKKKSEVAVREQGLPSTGELQNSGETLQGSIQQKNVKITTTNDDEHSGTASAIINISSGSESITTCPEPSLVPSQSRAKVSDASTKEAVVLVTQLDQNLDHLTLQATRAPPQAGSSKDVPSSPYQPHSFSLSTPVAAMSESISLSSAEESSPEIKIPVVAGTKVAGSAKSAKAKKLKEPILRKVRKSTDSSEGKTKERKPTKAELRHKEIQERKAHLEQEVAQALLEMKHTSPSPTKTSPGISETLSPEITPIVKQKKKISGTKSVIVGKRRSTDQGDRPKKRRKSDAIRSPSPDMADIVQSSPIKKKSSKAKTLKEPRLKTAEEARLWRLKTNLPPVTSTPTPTILSVPQVNGAQNLNASLNTSSSSSISFINTPSKGGPVKVSKTVVPPGMSPFLSDIEATIASVSSSFVAPVTPLSSSGDPPVPVKVKKPRKKKVTTATATELPGGAEEQVVKEAKPKKPRKRKTPPQDTSSLSASVDSMPAAATSSSQDAQNTESSTPPPKKARKKRCPSKPKLPFQLVAKPSLVPTVSVKPSVFSAPNGTTGTSISEKDKERAPSLKVIKGKTEFYRGGEKEEVDPEPSLPKRTQIEFDPNVPWLCCFCNLGPHVQKLGDLFGPYYTESPPGSPSDSANKPAKTETWMHQDCALWAGSVVLVGTKLHNLEETLANSKKDTCTTCGNKGATIGCLKRGCKQAVHYPCAIRKSWKLDVETFHSFCPAHIA